MNLMKKKAGNNDLSFGSYEPADFDCEGEWDEDDPQNPDNYIFWFDDDDDEYEPGRGS